MAQLAPRVPRQGSECATGKSSELAAHDPPYPTDFPAFYLPPKLENNLPSITPRIQVGICSKLRLSIRSVTSKVTQVANNELTSAVPISEPQLALV